MSDPWFPDYVAKWYDAFSEGLFDEHISIWEAHSQWAINSRLTKFVTTPHAAAVELDEFVNKSNDYTLDERRYIALRVASEVFKEMGFRQIKRFGGKVWDSIREHWRETGNLLRGGPGAGYLLPKEPLHQGWAWNHYPRAHTIEDYFRYFVRWTPDDNPNYTVKVSVIPSGFPAARDINDHLRIAVVPLVASVSDFDIALGGQATGVLNFSMSLKDAAAVESAALKALDESASKECDIVVFPELCLTPEIQERLRERLTSLGARPWLVVAGSARTPVGGGAGTKHHNRALVFDEFGTRQLSHNKQHPYSMSTDEEKRYSLLADFGYEKRIEDMEVSPREIEILDTDVGRLAVLICEDISVEDFVKPLVVKFGLDWLFVPVLDGCQMKYRWTAVFGRRYAEYGACVVVATSLSLAQQHLISLDDASGPPGVGTIVIPALRPDPVKILKSDRHDTPQHIDLPCPSDDL